jgi:hypothetical protein
MIRDVGDLRDLDRLDGSDRLGAPGAPAPPRPPEAGEPAASFSPAGPPSPAADRARSGWVGAALLVAAVVVPLLRQTGAHSWDTIWGEDGWVYFQQAHDHGLGVVLRGYAGYLQLTPRLLAIPTAIVPIHQLALYFAVVAAMVGAALAWFVYWASEGWVESRPVRLALASLVVLMPALGYENTANVTNTIWILLAVTPWALVARHDGAAAVRVRSVVAFAAATATALSAIFLPLALGYALVRRRRPTWTVCGAFCAGLVLQFAVVSHTHDTRPHHTVRQLAALPQIVGLKVFGQFLVGDHGIRALWRHHTLFALVAPVLVVGGLILAGRGVARSRRLLAAALVGSGVACFVVPAWGRGTNQVAVALTARSMFGAAFAGHYNPMSGRYGVAPVLALASAAAILLGSRRPGRQELARGLRVAFVAWVVVVTAVGFAVTNPRSSGPTWPGALHTARRAHCVGRAPATTVRVPTPNRSVNPPVVLRCRELGS